ncbi:hypothetical protein GCM10010206_62260 [Streptomyces cinerochromogenes]|nr:hypothetical protein GCM10010206_62260 [Streptomyces cinerochromogenes]
MLRNSAYSSNGEPAAPHEGAPAWKAWRMWALPDPMLAAPVSDPAPPDGWAAEEKWDGSQDTS